MVHIIPINVFKTKSSFMSKLKLIVEINAYACIEKTLLKFATCTKKDDA